MAQNRIVEIEYCNEFLSNNNVLQLSLIYNGDTLIFPHVGENRYESPVFYYNLDSTEFSYSEMDSTYKFVPLLLETCKYNYELKVVSTFVLDGRVSLCITGRRRNKLSEYNYGESSQTMSSWAKRSKVKKHCNLHE